MPGPAPTSAPPSGEVFRPTEKAALHSFNIEKTDKGLTPEEAAKIRPLAKAFEDGDARSAFDRLASSGTEAPSKNQVDDITGQFGKANTEGADPTLKAESERIKREADQLGEGLKPWLKYADILNKAAARGQTPEEYVADHNMIDKSPKINLNEIRMAGVTALIEKGNITALPKEILGGSGDDLIKIIDARLAQDPQLRERINQKIAEAKGKIDFRDIADDPELTTALTKKGKIDTQQRQLSDEIKSILKKSGITIDEETDLTALNDLLDTDLPSNTNDILVRLKQQLLVAQEGKFPEAATFNNHLAKIDQINTLRQEWRKTVNKDAAAEIELQMEALQRDVDAYNKTVDDDPALKTQFNNYNALRSLLSNQVDSSGNRQSFLAQRLDLMAANKAQLAELEKTILIRKQKAESAQGKDLRARLAEEAAALEEIKRAIPSSIGEILNERLAEIERIDAENKTAEGNQATQDAVMRVRRGKYDKYIGFENGKRVADDARRANIERHIKLVVHEAGNGDPEAGFKQIVFEMMQGTAFEDITARDFHNGTYQENTRQPKNYTELSPKDKLLVDEVYRQEGKSLKEKLFQDFFAQREMRGSLSKLKLGVKEALPGTDRMNLSNDEWGILNQQMQGLLEAGSAEAKGAAAFVADLERKGIITSKESKFKLLGWLLLLITVGGLGLSAIAASGGLAAVIPGGLGAGLEGIKAVVAGAGSGAAAVGNGS